MPTIAGIAMPSQPSEVPQSRLVRAAQEFEAQMMKELLKPMTESTGLDGDESGGTSGSALGQFATEALGQSLSRHGGLGLATTILHSLSRSENGSGAAPEKEKTAANVSREA